MKYVVMFFVFFVVSCNKKSAQVKNDSNIESNKEVKETLVDKRGNKLELSFDSKSNSATIYLSNKKVELKQQRVASGVWYKNEEYELRGKGDELELTQNGKIIFSNMSEEIISFTELKNYFVKNNYPDKDLHYIKATSQSEFDTYFGCATTMSKEGKPTPIDFKSNYVIAVIAKSSNIPTQLDVKNIIQKENALSVVVFLSQDNQKKNSYTSRVAKLVMVDKKYQGKITIEAY